VTLSIFSRTYINKTGLILGFYQFGGAITVPAKSRTSGLLKMAFFRTGNEAAAGAAGGGAEWAPLDWPPASSPNPGTDLTKFLRTGNFIIFSSMGGPWESNRKYSVYMINLRSAHRTKGPIATGPPASCKNDESSRFTMLATILSTSEIEILLPYTRAKYSNISVEPNNCQ